ncbi:MAG: AAA family ATPase [Candidatus Bathyarchaeia archaeon]
MTTTKLFEAKPAGSIFKDRRVLQSSDVTGKPLGRDAETQALAESIAPALSGLPGRDVFVFGKPGTGKTVCVRYVLDEAGKHVEEKGLDVFTIYVNAGRTRSPYYTLLEIVRAMGVSVHISGWQMSRLKQVFEKTKGDKPVIISVDEVDAILFKEREPLIYYLNRQPNTTLILVSNRFEDAAMLPERALSTLQPKLLMFEPYTAEEAKAILTERVEKALRPGVLSEDQLNLVAEVASKTGDIRDGFYFLLSAGLQAEREGCSKIETRHLEAAIKSETIIDWFKQSLERARRLKRGL